MGKKTYQYRLFPTKQQQRILEEQLALCAELYNAALQERRDAWRMCRVHITFTMQCAQLPAIKQLRPEYQQIHSQVLQQVLHRVDETFQSFFRRVKAGAQPGYPRFKSRLRYDTMVYPQSGFGIDAQGKLSLSKIGHLKIKLHRPFKGVVKTCTITRSVTGKWYACFCCDEVEATPLPSCDQVVGIDVGLKVFACLSTGETIANPHFFRQEQKALAHAQRQLARTKQGSKEREQRRKVVARVHERTRWRRENFIRQQVAMLIGRFGLIAVEALVVRSMIKNKRLAKSIADVAWSAFFTHLVAKAEETARQVVKVSPAYTSQTCSACGHRQDMPLSVRVYQCPHCGLVSDRDHNASCNILAKAHKALGRQGHLVQEALGL